MRITRALPAAITVAVAVARRLWRSRGEIASRWRLGVVTAGSHEVAFQHDHKLYLAPLSGRERPVADRELPLGWTRTGLYTYRYRTRQLLLRGDTGAVPATIARRPLGSDYFAVNGRLYLIVHGRASLQWHGRWLLDTVTGGNVAVIDTDHRTI